MARTGKESRLRWFARVRNENVTPTVLEPDEIRRLLANLESPFRVMVLLDVTTGLRRSELFALKWSDIDFWNLTIDIKRSIFQGVVGNCKTEASRRPVPLSLEVAADLWLWKESSCYATADDWVFASPRVKAKASQAGHGASESHSTGSHACWNQEKNRLAYIPPHLFNDAHCER